MTEAIRVAYAEDHVSVRQGIVKFLHGLGGVAVDIEANNGVEMLDKLTGAARIPDICIIDINMPEMGGFDLLMEIRKRWPRMRILILTNYGSEEFIIKMIKNGANGYLTKKSTVDEIKSALISIHQTGYYYSQIADHEKFKSVRSNDLKLFHLSDNDTQFLIHLAAGMTIEEIAQQMNKTVKSIKSHHERLCKKLNVKKKIGLILFAIKYGIVQIDF